MSANTLYKEEDAALNKKQIILASILFSICLLLFLLGAILICLLFPRSLKILQTILLAIDLVLGVCFCIFLLTAFLLPSYAHKKVLVSLNGETPEAKTGTISSLRQRTLFHCLPMMLISLETEDETIEAYYDLDKGPFPFKEGEKAALTIQGRFLVGYETIREESLD